MSKVKFECSCGDFTVELREDWAPKGVARFNELLEQSFFDGIRFFRVVTKPRPFIVQFGIHGDPEVSAEWRDNKIKDDPVVGSNTEGTLCFATSGPNTRTTQLFINYGDNSFLDSQGFSAIGTVLEGMDTVRKICDAYGESPNQGMIQQQGNAYLESKFPKMDYIISTTVLD
ncbi:MAG: peptidylprolyl isomerase [Candidatus Hydrogenedentes bacterium]|nr:peptidylprolyl isomerase [Candidatus Hydrogenedentota bacterium]